MPEDRIKFALRIPAGKQELIRQIYQRDNCSSQNEFIEKAIDFYVGYVSARDSTQLLSTAITSAIRGTLDDSEGRIARMLFKLSVEISMLMNILAASQDIDDETLRRLRIKCINDVKHSNGTVKFDDAVRYQRGQ